MYRPMYLLIKKIIRNKLIDSSLYQRLLRPLVSSRLSSQWSSKHRKNLRQMDKFCLFVGWGRSGSTLLSTLLNAHPQIAIAHEQLYANDLLEVSQNRSLRRQNRETWFVSLSLTREMLLAYLAKSAESQSHLKHTGFKHTGYAHHMTPPPHSNMHSYQ